ncbi:MAG: alpha-amylase family glycosyl hydrolase [Pseudomonadota bacterium]
MADEATDHVRPATGTAPGMGALLHEAGVTFRVWAPHARSVVVAGDFNAWSTTANPLAHEAHGYWSGDVAGAVAGQKYRFVIDGPAGEVWRKDPYGRDVDHSNGNSIIVDPAAAGSPGAGFDMPPWHELVIYEMHVGTYNDTPGGPPGDLRTAIENLDHLVELGVNAVQLMPCAEFPGAYSWGYNPSDIFAVETDYGGTAGLRAFIEAAHARGIAVIIDVVYNHLGPSDLDLWQFDGWGDQGGGIYFYNDWRAGTPWGHTRPDYGRGEVRQLLRDNALYWLDTFGADGLRWDMTLYIRSVHGNVRDAGQWLEAGWTLMRWINDDINARSPWKISIAEDLQDDPKVTRSTFDGGAGFDSQWAANFVHPVRETLVLTHDSDRSMWAIRDAITSSFDGEALKRVIYTESHDEVANGRARLPHDIDVGDPGSWYARKRSTLGAALVFTAPGIPMLFQGQEFLEDEWFRDVDPLDWQKKERFEGVFQLYRDLVRLRRNWWDDSRGLRGPHVHVFHVNDVDKVVAFHRWERGGPGDDVVVVLSFANRAHDGYHLGLPHAGHWRLRLNSDWRGYGDDYGDHPSYDVGATDTPLDGLGASGAVGLGPYSAVVLSYAG